MNCQNQLSLFFIRFICVLFLISTFCSNAHAWTQYDFKNLFVSPSWLEQNRSVVIVVDARSEKDHKKGHIPGAVSAPWQMFTYMDISTEDPGYASLLTREELTLKLAELGIDGQKPLLVYANTPGWGEDGRFAWMAFLLGIKYVKILDGGIRAWKKNGGKLTREKTIFSSTVFKPDVWNDDLIASIKWMQSNQGKAKIIDARTKREFKGAVKYGEARGGHLPQAVFIPFKSLFNSDGTIKRVFLLKAMFQSKGLRSDNDIAIYCTAGIRAAYMTLAFRMAGFKNARNYDGSMYEWAAQNHLPLVR